MFRVRVDCDSVSPGGDRLTSIVAEYPARVLREVNTHRAISKSTSSSRAMKHEATIAKVMSDAYRPDWTLNGRGMQGHGSLGAENAAMADEEVLAHRDACVRLVERLQMLGIHKQDANPYLDPFMWTKQVLTATSAGWCNFFTLRCHHMAHPAFQRFARMAYLAYRKSVPAKLEYGEWHLPFITPQQKAGFRWTPNVEQPGELPHLLQYSAARCAWTSYENHDRDGSHEAMVRTYNRLMIDDPKHASPVEHQGTPLRPEWHWQARLRSNLNGWLQARKLIPREHSPTYAPSEDEVASWGIDDSGMWGSDE